MDLNKLLQKKMKDFQVLDLLVLFIALIGTCFLKAMFIDLKVSDYIVCLKPWVDAYKSYGGFAGLRYEIGNYTPSYMHILMLISYFNIEPVYLIKAVAIAMDIFLAAMAAKLIGGKKQRFHKIALFFVVLMLPTVFINSGVWGQCDNFYASFLMCALCTAAFDWKLTIPFTHQKYKLLQDDLFMIFVGIAFAFKLQTIFLIPLFAMLFLMRSYRIRTLLWIPCMYLLSLVPSLIAGRSFKNLLTIYFRQTQDFDGLSLEYPNIYAFWQFEEFNDKFGNGCIVFCGLSLVIFVYYLYNKKAKMDLGMICSLGTFSILYITYLLPHMHDRYAYVAEILSLYYPVENKKKLYIPIVMNLIALESYSVTLLWFSFEGFQIIGALLRLGLIIITGMDVLERANKQ